MVKTMINLDEETDKLLKIIQAKNGFKNKNETIKHIIKTIGDKEW